MEELAETVSRSWYRFLEVRASLNSDVNGDDYKNSTASVWAILRKKTET